MNMCSKIKESKRLTTLEIRLMSNAQRKKYLKNKLNISQNIMKL